MVTGSTDGIGKQTALELAEEGHRVIVHGRNADKGRAVLEEIRKATGNDDARYCHGDLASFAAVRSLAAEVERHIGRIDVLINNAGVWEKERRVTEDGNELTLQVNFLAPFVLTRLLQGTLGKGARVVNVAALVHAQRLDLSNLQGDRRYSAWDAYARSKLYLIMFTFDLARRLEDQGVSVNSVHPGVIETKMLRKTGAHGSPLTVGARPLKYAALDPALDGTSGVFLVSDQPHDTAAISRDREAQAKLWKVAETLTDCC